MLIYTYVSYTNVSYLLCSQYTCISYYYKEILYIIPHIHIHIDGIHGLLYSSTAGTLTGFITGIIFLVITKRILDSYEHSDITDLPDLTHLTDLTHLKNDINKMFLIIFVMTLHSLTEGIGIGVSFGKLHV